MPVIFSREEHRGVEQGLKLDVLKEYIVRGADDSSSILID